jgi:hypothetical protein
MITRWPASDMLVHIECSILGLKAKIVLDDGRKKELELVGLLVAPA